MSAYTAQPADIREIFHRSLHAHLPPAAFTKLQQTSVLVAGLGGGANIAELLARKGIGHLIIADPDVFEPHNIRQRGSLLSTFGQGKTKVMYERLLDVQPHIQVTPVPAGITTENVAALVCQADYVVDMIDFNAMREKAMLYRLSRTHGKTVLTAPSLVNGAILYIFSPEGMPFEHFFEYADGLPLQELGSRVLKRLVPRYPSEAPEALYQAAVHGTGTFPLDAVGVDQAAVLAVAAIENLVLGRLQRIVTVPKGIHVDVSDASYVGRIVDYSADFGG